MLMQRIHDPVRKKSLVNTPEEEVRQNLIHWLIEEKAVPPSLIQVEVSLSQWKKGLSGRVDLVVHDSSTLMGASRPWLLVECKRPGETDWSRLEVQVNRYLRVILPRYLVLQIGDLRKVIAMGEAGESPRLLDDLPPFKTKDLL